MTYYGGRDRLFGEIEWFRADRQPCPVCGHPTGDCAGDAPTPATFFGQTEKTKEEDKILVEEDVTKEIFMGPGLSTRILVARAGSYISRKKAEDLGII